MKNPWFRRVGLFFFPASFPGWSILIILLIYAVHLFLEIDTKSHSASDTLMNFSFDLAILFVIYSLIGYLTSKRVE